MSDAHPAAALARLGLKPDHADALAALGDPDLIPARVAARDRGGALTLLGPSGERPGRVPGRLRDDPPAVGDWVAADGAGTVHAVLPRRGAFRRMAAGRAAVADVLAANVDLVVIVQGLDGDWNLRRLERFLALAADAGAGSAVLLNKADLRADAAALAADVRLIGGDATVAVGSALTGDGIPAIEAQLTPGTTAVLVGSSGAGKSTLANRLLGHDRQATNDVRAGDSRGRHTTTRRELMPLPGGGLLIDTPGLRMPRLWEAVEGIRGAFADVDDLARGCRFADCSHSSEPGCAVQAAIAAGDLDPARLAHREKLLREARYAAERVADRRARERAWGRRYHKEIRSRARRRDGGRP